MVASENWTVITVDVQTLRKVIHTYVYIKPYQKSFCLNVIQYGGRANAVPHYQKLRIRASHVWGDRRLQLGQVQCTSLHPEEPPA